VDSASSGDHKNTATPVIPLFSSGAKVVVDETSKTVTHFGGLCGFIVYLPQIGLGMRVPVGYFAQGIPLVRTLTASLFEVEGAQGPQSEA